MAIKPANTVINELWRQYTGKAPVQPLSAQDIVSFGKDVLSSQENTEKLFNVLSEMATKTIFTNRPFRINNDIAKDEQAWGIATRRIAINPLKDVENDAEVWESEDGVDYSPFVQSRLEVNQTLYTKFGQYRIHITVYGKQLKTAFTGEAELVAFIDYYTGAVEDQLNVIEFQLSNTAVVAGAALAYKAGTRDENPTKQAVNLIAAYGAETNDTVTLSNWREKPEFLAWASKKIGIDKAFIAGMNINYNSANFPRHTSEEHLKLRVLTDFAKSIEYGLYADTYHEDYVKLEGYKEVAFWQGANDPAAMSITADLQDGTGVQSVEIDNVVAVMFDEDAVGTTIMFDNASSIFNPRTLTTEMYYHYSRGLFADPTQNFIVYYMAEV